MRYNDKGKSAFYWECEWKKSVKTLLNEIEISCFCWIIYTLQYLKSCTFNFFIAAYSLKCHPLSYIYHCGFVVLIFVFVNCSTTKLKKSFQWVLTFNMIWSTFRKYSEWVSLSIDQTYSSFESLTSTSLEFCLRNKVDFNINISYYHQ